MSVQSGRNPLALLVCAFFWELLLLCLPSEGASQTHLTTFSQGAYPVLRLEDAGQKDVVSALEQGNVGMQMAEATPLIAHPVAGAIAAPGEDLPVVPNSVSEAAGESRPSLTQSTGTVTPAQEAATAREAERPAAAGETATAPVDSGVDAPAKTPAEDLVGEPSEGHPEASQNLSPGESGRFEEKTLERTGRRTMPDIVMRYPAFGNAQVDRDIEAWVEHIALSFERDLSGEPAGGPQDYNVAWLNATCTVRFASPTCASVVFDVWMHTGGAELSQDVLTLNYNLLTGQRLHIVDIFENVDTALRLLSEAARRELVQGAGELMQTDIENGTFPVPENFSSLAITERGITVNFQPYQVSRLPRAVSVEVPLEELLPAGPLLSLWGKK